MKEVPLTFPLLIRICSQRASQRSDRTDARVLPGSSFALISHSVSPETFTCIDTNRALTREIC